MLFMLEQSLAHPQGEPLATEAPVAAKLLWPVAPKPHWPLVQLSPPPIGLAPQNTAWSAAPHAGV